MFGKVGPRLDHCLTCSRLLFILFPKNDSIWFEDARDVVAVRHETRFFCGRRVEEDAEGEVVATGGEQIGVRWSHFAVLL